MKLSDGIVKVDPSIDGGKWYDFKCVSSRNMKSTEHNIPNDGWHTFPSKNIPHIFHYGHVYHYLLESVDSIFDDLDEGDGNSSFTAKPSFIAIYPYLL